MEAQRLLWRLARLPATTTHTAAATRRANASVCSLVSSSTTAASSTACPLSSLPATRRHKSTANRTKRALSIPPHNSFLKNGGVGAGSSAPATVLGSLAGSSATVIYNPPASAPSVYQTPFKFLPKSDPRRRSNLTSLFAATTGSPSSSSTSSRTPTAPIIPTDQLSPDQQKYHLSQADVAEIRRLRALDPLEWSVVRLASRFHCSPIFIMMVVRSNADHRARIQERVDAARQRWGPIRQKAKTERIKRREMLYNGEL